MFQTNKVEYDDGGDVGECFVQVRTEFYSFFFVNKDDNINKSKALKRLDKRTLTLVECHKLIRISIHNKQYYLKVKQHLS